MENNSLYNKLWLEGQYYAKVDAYYFKEWKHYDMDPHSHERIEIMYVIKGNCIVETCGKTMNMKGGELILLDSQVAHKLTANKVEACRMLNIEFIFKEKELSLPSLRDLATNVEAVRFMLNSSEKFFLLKDAGDIYAALKSCVIEFDVNARKDSEFLQQILLDQLIIRISHLYSEVYEKTETTNSVYVKKAQNYITLNYDYDISVEDIAKVANLHPGYLHRIFKQNTGVTIMQYLNGIRIEKAKMLLSNTNIPVTDISSYVGINQWTGVRL